jgi:Cdc6-like AAA superfamily ATPase
MDTKKRSHDNITPDHFNDHLKASSSNISFKSTLSVEEPLAKRSKLVETTTKSTTLSILENALASLVVEPSEIILRSNHIESSLFVPIVGREYECAQIEAHYNKIFVSKQPQPLFLCGSPGCGKTATVNKIIASCNSEGPPTTNSSTLAPYTVHINCATDLAVSNPAILYSLLYNRLSEAFNSSCIAQTLNVQVSTTKSQQFTSELEKLSHLLKSINDFHIQYSKQTSNIKPFFILTLMDEVDHLLVSKNSFSKELHYLFSLWLEPNGILSIISISNAYDLFDRYLPLLSHFTSKGDSEKQNPVEIIQFKPYTAEQLERILNSRTITLITMDYIDQSNHVNTSPLMSTSIFDSKAMKFLTGKIAKLAGEQAGDVRVLIDLAKASIIQARSTQKCPITLDIVAKVWKLKMSAPTVDPISQLPLVQKCVLIVLLSVSKAISSSEGMRPIAIETTWKSISKQFFTSTPPDLSELWRAIELLESIGHVQIINERGNRKIYRLQTTDQVTSSLSKDPLFQGFIL